MARFTDHKVGSFFPFPYSLELFPHFILSFPYSHNSAKKFSNLSDMTFQFKNYE